MTTEDSHEELITSSVAAKMLGMAGPASFNYHVQRKRIIPAKIVKYGKISTPYFRPEDVRRLGEELAGKYPQRAAAKDKPPSETKVVPENADSLVSASDAARIIGIRNTSTLAYHVYAGNITPATVMTMGGKERPMFHRADVEKLRDYLASKTKSQRRGAPRKN